ncbi:MAG: prepilin peptidase [Gammaproteobacteria bacterium]|nr:MAG: prepilin peptidase [Gammaproteobacteria bacterium]
MQSLSHNLVFLSLIFIFGLIIGSFLNVCIYRLPKIIKNQWLQDCNDLLKNKTKKLAKFNLAYPPSTCPACHKKLSIWQNIPIIGFLWQQGKCHYCQKPISYIYPAIELLTASLFVVVFLKFNNLPPIELLFIFALVSFLIVISAIDFKTQYIFDILSLSMLWVGLLYNTIFTGFATPTDAIIGAVAGYLSLYIVYWLFKIIRNKEGLGYGDFKLFAACGAWLGYQHLPSILLIASISGIIMAILILMIKKITKVKKSTENKENKERLQDSKIPFAPYLSFATLIILFWLF